MSGVAASLRLAADVLERAVRSGVEVDVPWWWLRDRADESHVATDPVCVLHLPPETPEQRREFDRKRGIPCGICVVTSPDGRCTCGADATSLDPAEVVVHRTDGPCYIAPAKGGDDA